MSKTEDQQMAKIIKNTQKKAIQDISEKEALAKRMIKDLLIKGYKVGQIERAFSYEISDSWM